MSFQQLRNILFSFSLLLILSAGWAFKALHVVLQHDHNHEAREICHVDPASGDVHIHDDRFAADECSLCAFVLSAIETPEILNFSLPLAEAPALKKIQFFTQHPRQRALEQHFGRGPPVVNG